MCNICFRHTHSVDVQWRTLTINDSYHSVHMSNMCVYKYSNKLTVEDWSSIILYSHLLTIILNKFNIQLQAYQNSTRQLHFSIMKAFSKCLKTNLKSINTKDIFLLEILTLNVPFLYENILVDRHIYYKRHILSDVVIIFSFCVTGFLSFTVHEMKLGHWFCLQFSG